MDESALPRGGCTPTKAAVLVKHGQQRHADAGALGGAQQAERHLGRVGISLSLGVVVQVMEFADAGVTRLQHVHIQARGNGLQLRGAELGSKSVHERAPAPEAVLRVAAVFGQTGHGPLKSMRVQIGHARQHRPCGAWHQGGGGQSCLYGLPLALGIPLQQDITGPAVWQQGVFGKQLVMHRHGGSVWAGREADGQ